MKKGKILVVDDAVGVRKALEIILSPVFADIRSLPSPNALPSTLDEFRPDVVLLDMNFTASANTGGEGLYWLSEIKHHSPRVEVVLFTAYADVDLAVEGMKRGAFDFVVKPWDNAKLLDTLTAARDKHLRAQRPTTTSRHDLHDEEMYWGVTEPMRRIRTTLEKVAPTDATVLITGENGVGKELLARALHAGSTRTDKPFVAVDAGAIPDTLFESELFGHVKGAFTDAHSDRKGKIELAHNGTLFLDEVGNIPLHLQAKLLRVLQQKTVTPVGSPKAVSVDFRLICATNADLHSMVQQGRFREDLYYRINTVHLHLPPLRERAEDILPLSQNFLARFADQYHRRVNGFTPTAAEWLKKQAWYGNIRQLQNCIEKAVILSETDMLKVEDLAGEDEYAATYTSEYGTPPLIAVTDEQTVRNALQRFQGNISAAAKALGVSRPTLYAKMKKYGL